MNDVNRAESRRIKEVLGGRMLLVLFGLGVLGFLVVIDRADWFAIRPATGTSIAMANAANTGSARTEDADVGTADIGMNTGTGKSINTP